MGLNSDEKNKEIEKKNNIRTEKIAKNIEHFKTGRNPKLMSSGKSQININVSKSLGKSVYTNYKRENMPPLRSNSSYFNKRGVIIYH